MNSSNISNNKPNLFDGIPIKHLTNGSGDRKHFSGVASQTGSSGNKRNLSQLEELPEGEHHQSTSYTSKRKPANLKSNFSRPQVQSNRFDNLGTGGGKAASFGGGARQTSALSVKKPFLKRQSTEIFSLDSDDETLAPEDEFDQQLAEQEQDGSTPSDRFDYEIEPDEDGELVLYEETGEWLPFDEFIQRVPEHERAELIAEEKLRLSQVRVFANQHSTHEIIPHGKKVVPSDVSTMSNIQGTSSSESSNAVSTQHSPTTVVLRDRTGDSCGRQPTPTHILSVPVPNQRQESSVLQSNILGSSNGEKLPSEHQPSRLRRWDAGIYPQVGQKYDEIRSASSTNAKSSAIIQETNSRKKAWG